MSYLRNVPRLDLGFTLDVGSIYFQLQQYLLPGTYISIPLRFSRLVTGLAIAIDERLWGLCARPGYKVTQWFLEPRQSQVLSGSKTQFSYLLSEMSDTRAARLAAQRSSPPPANYIPVAQSPEQVAPILEAPRSADYLPEAPVTHIEKEDNVLAYLATKEFYITLFLG